jgi:hypothetical protein
MHTIGDQAEGHIARGGSFTDRPGRNGDEGRPWL